VLSRARHHHFGAQGGFRIPFVFSTNGRPC
jgi:hypothetical protein